MFVALATAMSMSAAMAQAPRDAGAKMRGEFGGVVRSGGRSMRHAYDYSRDYRRYAREARTIDPQTAREHVEGIGRNIEQAKKKVAQARKEPELDKETLAQLDQIDKHLETVIKAHAELHEACMKETIEAGESMKCCEDINVELEKAIELHQQLVKRLSGVPGNTPSKN